MRRLEGRKALVTGAASGIGRAIVLRFAEEGASVFATDVQAEAVEETAAMARELGVDAEARTTDVSDPASVEATVAAAVERFGRLDALCNVAGILRWDNTHEIELADWNRVLAVNLTGTMLMCRYAIPHLLEARGAIVNMASTAALQGQPFGAAYAASKAGVVALTRNIAIDYGDRGLRCNAIAPGSIQTSMTQQVEFPEGANLKLLGRIMSLKGFGFAGPEKIASVAAMLVSDDGSHITGETIRVDGGALA
jgi:NAD(P)-dependent dehydrogenase (short-subunit alcohol dehydrogenase family)